MSDRLYETCKVSVQGVVALGGHFATLCQEVDFYEAKLFSLLIFKKKRQILLIILIVKSLQICYYDPQSAGINVQSPQSATTLRRLTLN